MINELFEKYKYIIYLSVGAIAITMVILAVKSPQPFLSAFIGLLGAVFGVAITQFSQWSMFKQEETAKFRLAALDKRLDKHQEAFTLWNQLMWSFGDPEKGSQAVLKGQDWWEKNCLYLGREAGMAFRKCFLEASLWDDETALEHREQAQKIHKDMMKTGSIIAKAVDLPDIGYFEKKTVKREGSDTK